jgi:hypothetical protein
MHILSVNLFLTPNLMARASGSVGHGRSDRIKDISRRYYTEDVVHCSTAVRYSLQQ